MTVVEDLVDDVVSDNVEEVLAIDEVAQRPSNQLEVRLGSPEASIFPTRHPEPSMRFARLLTKGELHVYRKLVSKKKALTKSAANNKVSYEKAQQSRSPCTLQQSAEDRTRWPLMRW